MCRASRRRDRSRLEHELQSAEYEELLRRLRENHPFYGGFSRWSEVLSFMHAGRPTEAEQDRVLRPILLAHAEDRDARWRTVLLAVFWPGLESIFWQKRHWDRDPDGRWQNVTWAFLQAVCRLDPTRRPSRLAAKVINDTASGLYRNYRSEWRYAGMERPTEDEELTTLAGGAEAIGIAAFELWDSVQARAARLRERVERGRISEEDYLMLVATRIYGETLADWCRDHAVDYELARKRRQRAEAKLRKMEEKSKKSGI